MQQAARSDAASTVIASGLAVGDEVRALQRVDRDVDLGRVRVVAAGPPTCSPM